MDDTLRSLLARLPAHGNGSTMSDDQFRMFCRSIAKVEAALREFSYEWYSRHAHLPRGKLVVSLVGGECTLQFNDQGPRYMTSTEDDDGR